VDPAFPGIFAATRAVGCSLSADVSTDVTASSQDMTVLNLGRAATAADDALNVAGLHVPHLGEGAFARIADEVFFISYIYFGTRTLTSVRGAAGTTAVAHLDGCRVSVEASTFLAINALGTLGSAVTVFADDEIPIASGTYIQIEREMMRVTAVTRVLIQAVYYDRLTVTRGESGTIGASHTLGLPVVIIHSTSLSTPLSTSDTNITLASGIRAGVSTGVFLKIADEVVFVTSWDTAGFAVVTRGAALTNATEHLVKP